MPRTYLEQTTELLTHARAMLDDSVSTPEAIFEEVKKAHRLLSLAGGVVRTDKDWRDAAELYKDSALDILADLDLDLESSPARNHIYRPLGTLNYGLSYEQVMAGQY